MYANEIKVDTDEGRFVLIVDSQEWATFTIDIHDMAIELLQEMAIQIGPYAMAAAGGRVVEQARED